MGGKVKAESATKSKRKSRKAKPCRVKYCRGSAEYHMECESLEAAQAAVERLEAQGLDGVEIVDE
jgi:hypothetical protein